jgi:hypothetical protein
MPSFYYHCNRNNEKKLLPGVQTLTVQPDPAGSNHAVNSSLELPNLQVCHLINLSRDPGLIFSIADIYQWASIPHRLYYSPRMAFTEVILIDIILQDKNSNSRITGPGQRSMWLDLAKSFDRSQRRLLIGVTEGSVCQGSDIDYSIFNNVRKLSEDEVLDMWILNSES